MAVYPLKGVVAASSQSPMVKTGRLLGGSSLEGRSQQTMPRRLLPKSGGGEGVKGRARRPDGRGCSCDQESVFDEGKGRAGKALEVVEEGRWER